MTGLRLALEWKPQDLWVGAYWRSRRQFPADHRKDPHEYRRYDVWVCVLPCLPLHATWLRRGPRTDDW